MNEHKSYILPLFYVLWLFLANAHKSISTVLMSSLEQFSVVAAQIDRRIEQGRCFANMAYAYSQLPDMEMACDYYKHALQAAKDKGNSWLFYCLSTNSSVAIPECKTVKF